MLTHRPRRKAHEVGELVRTANEGRGHAGSLHPGRAAGAYVERHTSAWRSAGGCEESIPARVAGMALTRTLEMLKAGERVNDLLYRSTLNGSRRQMARRVVAAAVARSAPDLARWHDRSRIYGALDPSRG
jgi:hypothetical protein